MPDEQPVTPDAPVDATPSPTGDDPPENTPAADDAAPTDNPPEETPINPDDFAIEERSKPTVPQDNPDDDDGMDPDDKARISKVVDKRLSPIEERLQKQQDEIEVNDYILNNPEMSKYKPVILKYMASPAYKSVPVKGIAAIVAASDMQKIGAAKERAAQRKVAETKNGGAATRGAEPVKFNPTTASFTEMEREIARVKGQVN